MRLSPTWFAALAAAVTLTACGSSPDPRAAPRQSPSGDAPTATAPAAPTAPAASSGATAVPTASTAATGKPAAVKPSAAAGSPSATPYRPPIKPEHQATAQELPIEATVTPKCARLGGSVTLRVTTKPQADIAYLAVYHGEKSGAAKPWGEGYGGNHHGKADFRGLWSDTWVVAPTAPQGDGRIVVVVGHGGKQRTIDVPFSVGGREADGCGT